MAEPELGKIKEVSVGGIWKHEAHDFTPWLYNNLALLGEAVDMDLEPVQREAQVGSIYLDILAKDVAKDCMVAIENQFGWSDSGHLGALLTYAAGLETSTVIWVAPHFRDEHRTTIEWLNRMTREDVEFYAVEVRAITIGDSLPAPEFRPVTVPSGWANRRPSPGQPYRDFFQPLVDELRRRGFTNQDRAYARDYQHFGSAFDGIEYAAFFGADSVWVYLAISTDDKDFNERVFDALQQRSEQIEAEIDAEWHWDRSNRYSSSYVKLIRGGVIDDPPEKLEETRAWMLKYLFRLKEVLDPHLEQVLRDLRPDVPNRPDA